MPGAASRKTSQTSGAASLTRAELSGSLRRICGEIGADAYLLAEPAPRRSDHHLRVVCSSWVYDAVEAVGRDVLQRIAEGAASAAPGEALRIVAAERGDVVTAAQAKLLRSFGHLEFCALRVSVRGRVFFAVFSAGEAGRLDAALLAGAHMRCAWAVDRFVAGDGTPDVAFLSERERECLRWVSEGKTTDEVAVILGVSSNTVNSYVAHAIQKFGANNRAMAIANAIRAGII